MCEQCGPALTRRGATQRRRIWELSSGWHCAVVGTCLTLSDLRSLAKKLSVKIPAGLSVDYQLHGFFVKQANTPGKPGKMLNKLLDKRHALAIRKTRALTCETRLEAFWRQALESGDIPGPYWALLSHPAMTEPLSETMFADVHMLSHLVGASNRADIRRLQALEEQNDRLQGKLDKRRDSHQRALARKDTEIAALRRKLDKHAALGAADRPPRVTPPTLPDQPGMEGPLADLCARAREIQTLKANLATQRQATQTHQNRVLELEGIVRSVKAENQALEQALALRHPPAADACPFDLHGQCLLYVGGRQPTVHRLRNLVADWNGRLEHHDGGVERSLDELASAVVRADAVVFPTDCVSHNAANTIKRLCQQMMKPYIPLRTSGVASFVERVKDGIDAPLPH